MVIHRNYKLRVNKPLNFESVNHIQTIMKRVVILFLFTSCLGFSQVPTFGKLDQYLEVLFQNDKFMGSLAVAKNGKHIYNNSKGYQYISYKESKMATKDSKYKIGSITKTFTATMIFQLIDEQKLSLETPLSVFYPKITNADQITINHLLSHSSGLYNLTNADEFGTWKNKPATPEIMVSRIKKFQADFLPGEGEEYSNTNYLLLGYIIENLDNTSYAEAVQNRIVGRLKLENTYYGGVVDIHNNECHSYNFQDDIWQQSPETHMSLPGGAGALISTPTDLLVFIEALFNGKLISEKSLKEMTITSDKGFGKGIFHTDFQGIDMYGHDGGIDGFQSMLVYVPNLKMALALTSNGLSYEKMGIVRTAFQASMGMDIQLPNFSKIELTAAQIKQYVGVYESEETPYNLVFEASGKTLKGAPEGSNLKELLPTNEDEFTFDAIGVKLNFNLDNRTLMFKQGDNRPIKFTKKQ